MHHRNTRNQGTASSVRMAARDMVLGLCMHVCTMHIFSYTVSLHIECKITMASVQHSRDYSILLKYIHDVQVLDSLLTCYWLIIFEWRMYTEECIRKMYTEYVYECIRKIYRQRMEMLRKEARCTILALDMGYIRSCIIGNLSGNAGISAIIVMRAEQEKLS